MFILDMTCLSYMRTYAQYHVCMHIKSKQPKTKGFHGLDTYKFAINIKEGYTNLIIFMQGQITEGHIYVLHL